MSEHRPPPGRRKGWYTDPRGGSGQRWYDGTTWTVATRRDAATLPPDPYAGLESAPGHNTAAAAALCLAIVSLLWNPWGVLGVLGIGAALLGRRRVRTWVQENYRPRGARIATWALVLSGIATTFTLLTAGFFS